MAAFTNTLGDLAQSYGNSYLQDRDFDLRKNALAAQISNMRATQQHAAGELQLQRDQFDAGKWYLDRENNYQDANGKPVQMMINRVTGEMRPLELPSGTMDSKTFQGRMRQLESVVGSPYANVQDPGLKRDMLLLASGFNPMTGFSLGTEADPNTGQPVNVMIPKGGGAAVPVGSAFGNGPSPKPNQINYQEVTDSQGNTVLTTVPRYAPPKVSSGYAVAHPAAVVAAGNQQGGSASAQAPAPVSVGAGSSIRNSNGQLIKKRPQVSADTSKMLEAIRGAQPALDDLQQAITQSGRANPASYWDSMKELATAKSQWALYRVGLPVTDPLYQEAFGLSDMYRNIISGPYLHGARQAQLIQQIRLHMPAPGDTPALMLQKLSVLNRLNPQIEQALIDYEKQRAGGVNALTPQLGSNASQNNSSALEATPDDVNAYAAQHNIGYGEALAYFQRNGITVKAKQNGR